MGIFQDLLGTSRALFRLGLQGPNLKGESGGDVSARNTGDTAYAAIRGALFKTYGDDFELNAGAAGAGADWKYTFRRPSTGMTHALIVVWPSADPAPGQALTVASFAGDVVTLQWTTIAAGNDKQVVDTTSLVFGSTSPVPMFTLPANAVVRRVKVIIDTPFNGNPQLSIGISGSTSKYLPATAVNLKEAATTVFEYDPGLQAVGTTEALIATYTPGSATAGAARIEVAYAVPS